MFLEASAMVELIANGPQADAIATRIEAATTPFYTGPTVEFEAVVAIARKKQCSVPSAHEFVLRLVRRLSAERMAITPEIGEQAVAAFSKYGKGRGHPAQLNFGDCFSYAMAKAADVPLLYVGNDFSRTDIG